MKSGGRDPASRRRTFREWRFENRPDSPARRLPHLPPGTSCAHLLIGLGAATALPMNQSALAGGVFRQIVDEARDLAIFVLDERGDIELWNIGAERTFLWTADEIIGRNFEILFTPEDRRLGMAERELETARQTGRS